MQNAVYGAAGGDDVVSGCRARLHYVEELGWCPQLLDFYDANIICCQFLE
jgi:hypothetical protein